MYLLFSTFITLMSCRLSSCYEYFLSNTSGMVEKDNFVYCSMSYNGTILIELTSFLGDCDLYVSQDNEKPTYETSSNSLSSNTCGIDSVIIPRSFKRPVTIGIYSHPSHHMCSYNLKFYEVDDSRDLFNFNPYKNSHTTLRDVRVRKEENSLPIKIYKKFYEKKKEDQDGQEQETETGDWENEDEDEDEKQSWLWGFIKFIIALLLEMII